VSKKHETSLERWTRIASEAKAITDYMRQRDPEGMATVSAAVRRNMQRIPQFAALRKLH
jgi:hypothetical protein